MIPDVEFWRTMAVETQPIHVQGQLQEGLYTFPYHHIPNWSGGKFQYFRSLVPSCEYASYIRHLVDRARSQPFQSILDLGCGDGRLCAELRRAYPSAQIVGVDVSERAIAFAKAFAPECEFHCVDTTSEDAACGPFDLVYMVEVLEHIELKQVRSFLESASKRLSPTGRLFLTVPSSNVPVSDKHFQHFSPESLERALSPHFVVQEIVPLNRITRWENVMYRLMGNRWFILSNPRLLQMIFRGYERRCLVASTHNCRRLLAICTKRSSHENDERQGNPPRGGLRASPVVHEGNTVRTPQQALAP